ncbi:lipopolysaccharide kinase InaA family protein [Dysgonomonas sp. OttesenSCG-928-M03]|nr:lipopolysaccharide kinase InaA family protein [Dysgonomonas sp. OttesenSCG-928-M03]
MNKLPDTFNNQGETLFGGRNEIKVIPSNGIDLNVKSFKVPNFINKVVYGNFRLSKARRSYEYANVLLERGINTPAPIGYIEERDFFLFGRSFYVCIHENFDGLMREFKTGKLQGRERLLSQFAQFTAHMHEKEVLHQDYSPGNILYKKNGDDYSFYLVDLNRMYFGVISEDEGCKSFRRLWGSDEMIAFIASEYAKARNFDVDKCMERTLFYHKEFWKEFSKRHKDKKPYIGE